MQNVSFRGPTSPSIYHSFCRSIHSLISVAAIGGVWSSGGHSAKPKNLLHCLRQRWRCATTTLCYVHDIHWMYVSGMKYMPTINTHCNAISMHKCPKQKQNAIRKPFIALVWVALPFVCVCARDPCGMRIGKFARNRRAALHARARTANRKEISVIIYQLCKWPNGAKMGFVRDFFNRLQTGLPYACLLSAGFADAGVRCTVNRSLGKMLAIARHGNPGNCE